MAVARSPGAFATVLDTPGSGPQVLLAGGLVLVAAVAGFAAAVAPEVALVGAVALAVAWWIAGRLLVAVAVLTASFFFENMLSWGIGGVALATPAKAIGALAAGAWVLAWGTGRRPVRSTPALWAIAALGAWIVLSAAGARDQATAVITSTRWVMFFLLYFLVVQAADDRRSVVRLVDVAVVAAAASAWLGLQAFFGGVAERASGPVDDPNDFGFLLASVLPLGLYRITTTRGWVRVGMVAAVALTAAGVLASFSRGALLGLAAAGLWAVVTRRIPVRAALAALAALVLTGALTWLVEPTVVEEALGRKESVAAENVDTRVVFWGTAWRQFTEAPVTGVGPGNYQSRFREFNPDYGTFDRPFEKGAIPTTHNTYLNVLAELGVVGFVAFLTYLFICWRDLRRRTPEDPDADALRSALAGGFVVALVGSFFLTQQFYPPIWFLPALAVGLDRKPA